MIRTLQFLWPRCLPCSTADNLSPTITWWPTQVPRLKRCRSRQRWTRLFYHLGSWTVIYIPRMGLPMSSCNTPRGGTRHFLFVARTLPVLHKPRFQWFMLAICRTRPPRYVYESHQLTAMTLQTISARQTLYRAGFVHLNKVRTDMPCSIPYWPF